MSIAKKETYGGEQTDAHCKPARVQGPAVDKDQPTAAFKKWKSAWRFI